MNGGLPASVVAIGCFVLLVCQYVSLGLSIIAFRRRDDINGWILLTLSMLSFVLIQVAPWPE